MNQILLLVSLGGALLAGLSLLTYHLIRRRETRIIKKGGRCTLHLDGITAKVFISNVWNGSWNGNSYQLVFSINGRGININDRPTRINSGGDFVTIYPRSWDHQKWNWILTGKKAGKNTLRVTLSKKPRR